MNNDNEPKKSFFGQMTLIGLMALDWLKPEGKTMNVKRVLMGDAKAFAADYYIPEWANGIIAIIHDLDKFVTPLLVTQNSCLAWLESMCMTWEMGGAATVLPHNPVNDPDHFVELILADSDVKMVNMKKSGKKQFDKYVCEVVIPKKKKK